jgi:hypothetical protein
MDDRTHLLASLYVALKNKAIKYRGNDYSYRGYYVNLDYIDQIFTAAGLDIDHFMKIGVFDENKGEEGDGEKT